MSKFIPWPIVSEELIKRIGITRVLDGFRRYPIPDKGKIFYLQMKKTVIPLLRARGFNTEDLGPVIEKFKTKMIVSKFLE